MNKTFSIHKLTFLAIVASFLFGHINSFGQNYDQLDIFKKEKRTSKLILNNKGFPKYIEGRLNPADIKRSKEEQALRFFEENKGIFGLNNPRKELKVTKTEKDNLGFTHIRLGQYYHGIRVYGSEVISHFSRNNELRVINGEYLAQINAPYSPKITISQAQTIACEDSSVSTDSPTVTASELVIYETKELPVLTWLIKVSTENPGGRWEYFVDAIDGSIIYKANRINNEDNYTVSDEENNILPKGSKIETADGTLPDGDAIGSGTGVLGDYKDHIDTYLLSGQYYLVDNTRRAINNPHNHNGQMQNNQSIITRRYGESTEISDADNSWISTNQAAGIDAHFYAGLVYDFLLDQFERNSYDGNGIGMLSIVENYTMHNNAQWDGSQVTFFSVTQGYYSLAGCIDVVAHEWGHALTEFQSNLLYESESGALNESFSDMLGIVVGFGTVLDTDWFMGEDFNGIGFRNIMTPHQFNQPDTYQGIYWANTLNLSFDYGGVHTNSGVPNKMFYLLAEGGTHNGITVTGIGISNAIDIMYRANAYYWTVTTTFENAKEGCISAANDLDATGNWGAQTRNAWEAVKVGIITTDPQSPTIGTITHPTCTVETGSVILNDLPSTGTWILTRTSDGETVTGTGTSTTITGLAAGSHSFTVTNASGNTSGESAAVVINTQPPTSPPPTVETISPPSCTVPTGSIILSGLPETGTWALTRTPGETTIVGTGISTTIAGLAPGTYTYKTTNASGCTSQASANIDIIANPATPPTPIVGTVTQPTCTVATGNVALSGLPATGTWTLTKTPDGETITGTGTSTIVTGLSAGACTFSVKNASGCISEESTNVVINDQPVTPLAPSIVTISQPTCAIETGSVALANLPSTGTWTLTRTPGGTTTTGTGTNSTIPGLTAQTYNYVVTNESGCTSVSSENIVINLQPEIPTTPDIGTITQPVCGVAGSVDLIGLPVTGTWMLTRIPGGVTTTGTGTSTTIPELPEGTFTFTVTGISGCTSVSSSDVIINYQPVTPSAPTIQTIIQPGCSTATGSAFLSGLPATGTWILTRAPDGVTKTGTGTSTNLTGLTPGTYTYIVTNASGCTSSASANVKINPQPITPTAPAVGIITHPTCSLATGSVVLSDLPETGTWTLRRYPGGTIIFGSGTDKTVTELPAGTYTFTITNSSGCTSPASSEVLIIANPLTPQTPAIEIQTQPTCTIETGSAVLSGLPATGTWTLTRNPGGPTIVGSGTTITLPLLEAGIYSYSVTDESGCISEKSPFVIINTQPETPSVPTIESITQPSCMEETGNAVISGLQATGTWTLTRIQNGYSITGSGTTARISSLTSGTYNYIVTNESGCSSTGSGNIVINDQPITPNAPAIGTIIQPTCELTGSVVLNSLPTTGIWTITSYPDGKTTTGTGTSTAITGLEGGTFSYTVTDTSGCTSVRSSEITINDQPITPTPPVIGTVTQPTCNIAGSLVLNGLPDTGTWTLTRNPDEETITGTETNITLSGVPSGLYSYTVKNESGCTSILSANVFIDAQPEIPSAPIIDSITHPSCLIATGSAVLSGLPASGTWTLTRYPDEITLTGSGTSTALNEIPAGIYTYTITNTSGCTSIPSDNVVINLQPETPTAPIPGAIIQPICSTPTGSIVLNGLPVTGAWTLVRAPDGITTPGTGTSTILSGLEPGTYTFSVVNTSQCISTESAIIIIDVVRTGIVPKIRVNPNDVLICYNSTDSIKSYQWYYEGTAISADTLPFFKTDKKSGIYEVETIDLNGCKNLSNSITISGPKSLSAYPNPASVSFVLKLNDQYEDRAIVRLINSSGTKVMEFQTENKNADYLIEIPVNNLDIGIYLVQVLLNQKDLYYTKVIVVK